MFGFFKRKQSPSEGVVFDVDIDTFSVLVRESDFNQGNEELVAAVVDFFDFAFQKCRYAYEEVSGNGVRFHCSNYYIAQWFNGGNCQFIQNCTHKYKIIYRYAREGLELMGAEAYVDIIERVNEKVPDIDLEYNDFHDIDEEDYDFFEAIDQELRSIYFGHKFSDLQASWIRTWPELQVVEDAKYEKALERYKAKNKNFDKRVIHQAIFALGYEIRSKSVYLPLGIVASAAQPVVFISGHWHEREILFEGHVVQSRRVRTFGNDHLIAVYTAKKLKLFKAEEWEASYDLATSEILGDLIAEIDIERIDTIIENSKTVDSASSIYFLLGTCGIPTNNLCVQAVNAMDNHLGKGICFLILTKQKDGYMCFVGTEGAQLQTIGDQKLIGVVSKQEIQDFIASIEIKADHKDF